MSRLYIFLIMPLVLLGQVAFSTGALFYTIKNGQAYVLMNREGDRLNNPGDKLGLDAAGGKYLIGPPVDMSVPQAEVETSPKTCFIDELNKADKFHCLHFVKTSLEADAAKGLTWERLDQLIEVFPQSNDHNSRIATSFEGGLKIILPEGQLSNTLRDASPSSKKLVTDILTEVTINQAHSATMAAQLLAKDTYAAQTLHAAQTAPQDWRYTQSIAFLKIVMKQPDHLYDEKLPLADNIKTFFKFYEDPIFNTLNSKAVVGLENDTDLVNLAEKIIKNEDKHKNMFVFYHAANETIGFLYDIYSEFRRQLMIRGDGSTVDTLRALDTAFAVAASMPQFLTAMDDLAAKNAYPPGNPWYNYLPGYVGAVINANNYLFGNYASPMECSWYYFLVGHSAANLVSYGDWNSFLRPLFLALGFKDEQEIALRVERYKSYFTTMSKLSQEQRDASPNISHHTASGVKGNGTLLQIFIDPKIVDTISYTSEWGGPKLNLKINEHAAPTHDPSSILALLRKDPLAYETMLKANLANFTNNGYPKTGPAWDTLSTLPQTRILLAPKYFYDPPLVKIYDYRRFPKVYTREYRENLANMVTDDLARWLEQGPTLEDVTITPAKPGIPAEVGRLSPPIRLKDLWKKNVDEVERLKKMP